MDWTEKYRPKTTSELVGNQDNIRNIIKWIKGWNLESDPLLIYGPPGLGKTTIAHAIANDLDLITFEINASNKRTRKSIGEELNRVAQSGGFIGETRLVIVDEVDNLDRGGSKAVNEALDNATQPVMLICNDYWGGVPRSIRDKCEDVEFDSVREGPMVKRMMDILENEDVKYETDALRKIAQDSEGDVRSAINDLQSVVKGIRKKQVKMNNIRSLYDEKPPKKVIMIGSNDINPKEAREVLEDMKSMMKGFNHLIIRGMPGFDIVAGEWAIRNNIDVSIRPPFYKDRLLEDTNEIWEMRYDEIAQKGDHFDASFYKEDPDWEDYAGRLTFGNVDMAYGWITEDTDEITKEIWNNLKCEKANLSKLVVT